MIEPRMYVKKCFSDLVVKNGSIFGKDKTMVNKRIIIHNVDVSECKKYEHEMIRCNTSLKNMCFYGGRCTDKKNADCYYKQLKIKEQECEELKKEQRCAWKSLEGTFCPEAQQQLNQLKAENEILKEKLVISSNSDKKTLKIIKTLTEIKEIAEKIDDSGGCAYGDYDCDNCSSLEQEKVCTYKVKRLILQKISECEGNDE